MSKMDGRGSEPQRHIFSLLCSIYRKYTVIYEQAIPSLNQRFDTFVQELGIAVEYDGAQHNKFIEHFHRDINGYLHSGMLDRYKNDFAIHNGIKLIRLNGDVMDLSADSLKTLIDETPYPANEYNPECLRQEDTFKELQRKKRSEFYKKMKKKRKASS